MGSSRVELSEALQGSPSQYNTIRYSRTLEVEQTEQRRDQPGFAHTTQTLQPFIVHSIATQRVLCLSPHYNRT
ncbi:hypothetical protein OPQ81_000866 [Rhizoctonia solani]|nr:hypothetical protein OPQ81_000866 [Rhizoctonia solani]